MNPSYFDNSDMALTKFLSEPDTTKKIYPSNYEPKGILHNKGLHF